MKKSTKRERLVWLGWLLVGIGAAALVGLLCMPWPMAKAAGRRGGQRRDGGERHGVRRPGDGHGAGQRELSEACRLPAGDSRPVERLYGKDFYTVSRGIV